jgi:histone deacetylase 6
MDDEDLVMGEDMVIASTEVNGNHASDTVNPAMISLNPNQQAPLRTIGKRPNLEPVSDELDMTTDAPRSPTSYIQEGVVNSSVPDIESDDMDFTYARTSQVEVRIPPPPRFPRLPYSSSKTGLVYDARMRFHCEPLASMIREDDIHPEDPRRIYEIFEEIRSAGLVQGSDEDEEDANDEQCWRIHARAASKAEICLVHTPDHYDFIKDLRGKAQ